MRRLRLGLAAFGAVLAVLGLTAVTVPGASAAPAGGVSTNYLQPAPSGCGERHGADVLTQNSWYQQAQVFICKTGTNTWRLTTHVSIRPTAQFATGNVVGCTGHMIITHIGGSYSDLYTPANCLDAAKRASGGYTIPDEVLNGVGPGTYRLDGFINIQTGTYYSGSGTMSSSPNFTLA